MLRLLIPISAVLIIAAPFILVDKANVPPSAGTPTLAPAAPSPIVPTPTKRPTPIATSTPVAPLNLKWAGVRSSPYGINPFPSAEGWGRSLERMHSYFPDAQAVVIWLVGQIYFADSQSGMDVNFPNPGGDYDAQIRFASTDANEAALDYFDAHGIKVFLQFEPGLASVKDLIDVTYKQYGRHSSIAGFGVDVEWYQTTCETCAGAAVDDATAEAWERQVKALNPDYRLFLKHFEPEKLPPAYRGDVIFVDDSQQFANYDAFVTEMQDFARQFYPADVLYQAGYPADRSWWGELTMPIPETLGAALSAVTRQNCGIIWVDFTLRDVLPPD